MIWGFMLCVVMKMGKEGIIDDINREVSLINKQELIEYKYIEGEQTKNPKNEWNCSICSDMNVLKEINKICIDFINEVKDIYTQKYYI